MNTVYKVFEKVGTRFILRIREFKWVTRVDVFWHVIGVTCLYEDVNMMFLNFCNLPRPVGDKPNVSHWAPLFYTELDLHHFHNKSVVALEHGNFQRIRDTKRYAFKA